MMQVAANLGFFFRDRPLVERFAFAAALGFKLVETHALPLDPDEVARILKAERLQLIGLNAGHGAKGTGIAAHETDLFHEEFDHALEIARVTGAKSIHILPGDKNISNRLDQIALFENNLRTSAKKAEKQGVTILLEALNPYDRPNYYYNRLSDVVATIIKIGAPNIKIMADTYHIARSEGEVINKLTRYWPLIGHLQVAGVPERREIDVSELHYPTIFNHLKSLGFSKPIGLEYISTKSEAEGLRFMQPYGLTF